MKKGPFHDRAVGLYDGPGPQAPPRYREGIIASIELALEEAYQQGRREMEPAAVERALRESLAIATGLRQGLESREKALALQLRDQCDRMGKTTT